MTTAKEQRMFSNSEYSDETFTGLEIGDSDVRFKTFENCIFSKCRFNGTRFVECKFSGCRFKQCDLSLASVKGCIFSGVEFTGSKLTGINWTEANWRTMSLLKPLAFDNCTLNYGTFIGLTLRKLTLTHCVAHDVDFTDADLTLADLRHTDLSDSRFQHTNLTEANLVHARNYSINAGSNKLKKTKFALPEAISLLRSLDIVLLDESEATE